MTVTAEDKFEVTITITVTNKATGDLVTETTHTDAELNYGSMQAFRQVIIGAINDKTGELGQILAESFGQPSLRNLLNMVPGAPEKMKGSSEPGPGVIR